MTRRIDADVHRFDASATPAPHLLDADRSDDEISILTARPSLRLHRRVGDQHKLRRPSRRAASRPIIAPARTRRQAITR